MPATVPILRGRERFPTVVPTSTCSWRRPDRLGGCYLVGSVLYLVEAPAAAAWLFVIGSLAALLATVLPQLVRLWIQPREGDGGGFPDVPCVRSSCLPITYPLAPMAAIGRFLVPRHHAPSA